MSGIYFLSFRKKVVYIGQSKAMITRVMYHISQPRFKFDSVRIILCAKLKLNYYEARWTALFKPQFNTRNVEGRLEKKVNYAWVSKNIKTITKAHDDECAYRKIMQKARNELNYSPMTDNNQIWQGITGRLYDEALMKRSSKFKR
jgi:hypothetical protein